MAIPITMFEADAAAMIVDMPGSLVWGSQTVACACAECLISSDTRPEGQFTTQEIEVTAVVKDFTNSILPANRDKVVVTDAYIGLSSVAYFVDSKTVSGGVVQFRLKRVS